MKNHIVPENLSAYVDDALSDVERLEVKRHLALCGRCSQEAEKLGRVRELLRPRANFPVPPFFATRLAALLKEKRQRNVLVDFVWMGKRLVPGFAFLIAALWLWATTHSDNAASQANDFFSAADSTTAMSLLAENDRELTTEDVLHLAVYEPSDTE
jgi:anti-sigma factor RsiW